MSESITTNGHTPRVHLAPNQRRMLEETLRNDWPKILMERPKRAAYAREVGERLQFRVIAGQVMTAVKALELSWPDSNNKPAADEDQAAPDVEDLQHDIAMVASAVLILASSDAHPGPQTIARLEAVMAKGKFRLVGDPA